ncbi:MAG: Fic family protein [Syntrophobacteraceae bacterium]
MQIHRQKACVPDVAEIMTFKSGKFILSRKCDDAEIRLVLLEASILYDAIKDLPILPKFASKIDQDLIRRSIHGTAAIEGNPLDEEQVGKILSESGQTVSTDKAAIEIRNLKKAYGELMVRKTDTGGPLHLSESYIRDVHKTITFGIDHPTNEPGVYRNHRVAVGDRDHGGKYVPPKALVDINHIMSGLIEWINNESNLNSHPFIRAAIAHYHLGKIHPFGDGNGRTARFVEAAILTSAGYKYIPKALSNYYYKNEDDYYIAFRQAEKDSNGDITPFVHFVLNGIVASLREMKAKITVQIRILVLRDYIRFLKLSKAISQRQYDLLTILLERFASFTIKDLFAVSPFNVLYRKISEDTARRDLKRLKELKLLSKENNSYRLNLEALG